VQPSGNIVLVGNTTIPLTTTIKSKGKMTTTTTNVDAFGVATYNPDGSLDTTFGNGAGCLAIADQKFAAPDDWGEAVAIAADGKAILAGSAASMGGGPWYSQVGRLNVDGSLDATFGTGGLVTTALGKVNNGADGQFHAVAIQPDGKILAAGYAAFGNQSNWSLARYLPSSPQIASFTANPNPVTAGSSVTLTASNITDGNPNSSVAQVTFYSLDSAGNKTTLGTAAQTSPGVWTLTVTVNLTAGGYTLYAQAQDSYGVFGDPFALNFQVS
jgi:uncharacterized delta-60 repeat protein